MPSATDAIDVQRLVNGRFRPQQSDEDDESYQATKTEHGELQEGLKTYFRGSTSTTSQVTALTALIARAKVNIKSPLSKVKDYNDFSGIQTVLECAKVFKKDRNFNRSGGPSRPQTAQSSEEVEAMKVRT